MVLKNQSKHSGVFKKKKGASNVIYSSTPSSWQTGCVSRWKQSDSFKRPGLLLHGGGHSDNTATCCWLQPEEPTQQLRELLAGSNIILRVKIMKIKSADGLNNHSHMDDEGGRFL